MFRTLETDNSSKSKNTGRIRCIHERTHGGRCSCSFVGSLSEHCRADGREAFPKAEELNGSSAGAGCFATWAHASEKGFPIVFPKQRCVSTLLVVKSPWFQVVNRLGVCQARGSLSSKVTDQGVACPPPSLRFFIAFIHLSLTTWITKRTTFRLPNVKAMCSSNGVVPVWKSKLPTVYTRKAVGQRFC